MSHLQDQIVASIKATLVAAGTVAGANVVVEGVDDIPTARHPVIEIEIGPETCEAKSMRAPRTVLRTLDVYLRLTVSQNTGYRVAAGDLLAQVERALHATEAAHTAGGIAPDGIHLIGSDPDRDGNASKVVYTIRTLWRVKYLCKENAPDEAA